METKALVKKYLEYKNDIIKFAEECILVEQPHGIENIKLDYKQKKILRTFNKDHNLCILSSRQVGVSTVNKILLVHTMVFNTNCTIGVISRNKQYLEDINFMIEHIPIKIVPKYIQKTKKIIYLENGCKLLQTYNPNPHLSFLGTSLNILIVEDAAYIDKLEELTINLYPALVKVQEVSKELNKPYGIIMCSASPITDKDNYFMKIWNESLKGNTFYTPIKITWRSVARLREDKNWYNNICKCFNDKKRIDRELNLKYT